MPDTLSLILGMTLGILGSLLIFALYRQYADLKAENARLQAENTRLQAEHTRLQERIAALESNGAKRHTHPTAAGLEDALGIAIDVLNEYASSQRYTEARLAQLTEVLRVIRAGPYEYDIEKQAGKRPNRRHEAA